MIITCADAKCQRGREVRLQRERSAGAGNGCDGQVLVYADALGMTQGFKPKFLRHFAQVGEEMTKGVKAYIDAVKTVDYPSAEESY